MQSLMLMLQLYLHKTTNHEGWTRQLEEGCSRVPWHHLEVVLLEWWLFLHHDNLVDVLRRQQPPPLWSRNSELVKPLESVEREPKQIPPKLLR